MTVPPLQTFQGQLSCHFQWRHHFSIGSPLANLSVETGIRFMLQAHPRCKITPANLLLTISQSVSKAALPAAGQVLPRSLRWMMCREHLT
jgi:hypothetical protein